MSSQYQVILRAFNDKNQKFDLEIINNLTLKLDISAIESQEIGKIFGISSQTFTLPGTDTNNQFFNNVFDLGTTPAVAFGKTAPCQVLVDGAAVFTGKLYIESVVSDQYNDVIYNCVVTNETIDFKTLVENRTLASLANNWTKYNHLYNWANVTSSWDNKLFSGSVFYPLANYGSQVNDPTSPVIGFTAAGVAAATGSMDNAATPLKVSQMKPAIQVKTILDEIFASVNYKYTSSFINTDYFKSIYMLSSPDEKEGVSFVNMVSQSVNATPTVTQQLIAQRNFIFDKINFGTEIIDTGNNWNPSTSTYTVKESGSYTISSNLTFTISNIPPSGFLNNNRTFQWQVQVNGAVVLNSNSSFGTSTSGIVGLPATVLNLKAGDTVQIFGRYVGRIFNERFNITAGPNSSWIRFVGAPTSYNGTVNIGSVFAPDMKILDFIKGLTEKFNLVIEPVRNEKNILRIETFNDWIDQGTVVDWTDIVDRNTKYKLTSPLISQARNLYLSDALDEDVLNQNYKSIYGKIYGEYKFTTPLDLAQGDKRLGEVFGATPTRYINNSKEVEVPWLCKEEDSKALVPFKFKPRLLHKQPYPQIVPQNEAMGVSGSLRGYYILDGTTTRLLSVYNTALPTYRDSVVDPVPKSSLHFDSSTFRQYKLMPFNKYIPGAYDNYWSFWINEIYDIDARLLTCNIILKPSEIQNIQLNDKIFIDGQYYRINKINGANLVNTDSIEVELLKTAPRKIPYNGRRRVLTPRSNEPNAFVDAIIDTYNDDGSITYADFETGAIISDQEVIAQVVGVDGKDYYAGITWDNEQYQVYNPNIIAIGATKYNESHTNIISVGNGNTITDYTANSFIVGDNNIINPATYITDETGSYGNITNVTLIASDATISDSTNIVLIQPSGSRTISGSINNVLINPINDITLNDPTGSVYTGNLRNQGTADFAQGLTATGSINITGQYLINGVPISGSGGTVDTGSLLITASYTYPNLTFTKGDGSTFDVFLPSGSFTPPVTYISASGGVVTTSGSFRIHTFTGSGNFIVSSVGSAPNNTVETLVVAGGGGGASAGGGAGGLVYTSSYAVTVQTYPITVGAGGAGATNNTTGPRATDGSNSVFDSLTAVGGGGGGNTGDSGQGNGAVGGSGGGGGAYAGGLTLGGAGTIGQGNSGAGNTFQDSPFPSGGGGGASSNAPAVPAANRAGDGANGTPYSISGVSTYYAGGGGGATYLPGGTDGTGGLGGGGNGGNPGTNGTANTGGGGGASRGTVTGGNGGSGIVIIKYQFQP